VPLAPSRVASRVASARRGPGERGNHSGRARVGEDELNVTPTTRRIGVLDSLDLAGTWERDKCAEGRSDATVPWPCRPRVDAAQDQLLALLDPHPPSGVPAPARGATAHGGNHATTHGRNSPSAHVHGGVYMKGKRGQGVAPELGVHAAREGGEVEGREAGQRLFIRTYDARRRQMEAGRRQAGTRPPSLRAPAAAGPNGRSEEGGRGDEELMAALDTELMASLDIFAQAERLAHMSHLSGLFVCVCVRARECACACVCVCVRVRTQALCDLVCG
jgi:hypothetical protein